jgi:hypothetical protein
VAPFHQEDLTGKEFKMRRLISFALVASLLFASPAALAQNTSPLASTDVVKVTRVDANGNGTPGAVAIGKLFNGTGIGYGVGAGGVVTQLTSRTTGVTLNTFSGQITMFSAAGSATAASFTVTDSAVAAGDDIILNEKTGTNLYVLSVTAVAAGSFQVTFFTTGGTATDAPVITFAVIHASAS